MAKNKKSKILAMALCASVMTGIYAAPVMAGMVLYTPTEGNLEIYISGYEDHPYSDTINFDGSSQEIYGRLNISGNNIATALTGTNLTLNSVAIGTDTINAATIARWNATARANENVGGIERSAGATTPGTGTTTIEGSTSFDATGMTVGDDKFIVDTDGNVIANSIATSGDIVTLSGDVVAGTYSLKTVGDLTQNIDSTRTTAGTTTFKGDVNVDGNVKAATGSFDRMTLNGSDIYAGGHVLKVGDQTLNFLLANRAIENTAGIERVDYGNGVGETTIEGATTFDQSGMGVYTSTGTSVVSGGQATFRDNSGGFTQIMGGNVTASGDIVSSSGEENYSLNTIGGNTAGIERTGNSKNTYTVIEDTLKVRDGYISNENESFVVNSKGDLKAANGHFHVDRYGNTKIDGDVTMAVGATVDGVDVSELGGNVAGISRNNGDLPYGQGVTTIEGVVSVDGQSGLVNFSTGNGNGVLINSSQGQIIASSVGANQIVGENLSGGNGAFRVSENGDILMQNGSGESISMTDGGLNLMSTDNGTGMVTLRDGSVSLMGNGTSTVTVDENGTTFGTVLGSETTNINGGTVTASGDFVTVDENGNEKYTLNTIGDNTQAIKYQDGVTTIGGETLAVTDEGYVTINNGAFAVGPDGMATVGNNIQLDGETGVVSANDLRANNNVYSKNYNLEEVGADLKELSGDFTTTNANVAGIKRTGSDEEGWITTIEGSTSFDANGMNVGNGAVVANSDGSFSAGNGSFKVSDGVTTIGRDTLAVTDEGYVTINNGAFAVGPDGMVAVGNSIQFDGETGVVYANDLKAYNNVYSKNYNLEEVGADLDDLTGSVGNIGDNVAGITRDAEDGALPGEGTTTIEDTLSVSGDSVLAQIGSSQLVITEDVAGLSSGNASFALSNNELQLSVAGNGLLVNQFGTNLNGTVNFIGHDGNSYTLSDLEGRVYDLEQKTQNITSAEPGQGGSSEVPPTGDGHTGFEGDVTVGGDINADEGNFNKVNTDEINVGDNTFIDGDSVNSNEGNFKDKVTVGSGENQTVINNGGITVGDSEGTSINHDEVRVGGEDGSYMNENDVVTGEGNSLNDTANRVGNLEQGVSELNNRVGELEDRIDKVGAMAAAIANLRTMGYDPAAPTEVAVGIGQYRDETGAALGLFHYPNRDFMLSLSVSTSGDEVMGGIGATWKFGRKSPEKVAEIKKAQAEADARRAEEAKLAKAEEMKQAAKEAKIKAQQERHAKLAAERAAQAEAAK